MLPYPLAVEGAEVVPLSKSQRKKVREAKRKKAANLLFEVEPTSSDDQKAPLALLANFSLELFNRLLLQCERVVNPHDPRGAQGHERDQDRVS
jgi:hypothetical protein